MCLGQPPERVERESFSKLCQHCPACTLQQGWGDLLRFIFLLRSDFAIITFPFLLKSLGLLRIILSASEKKKFCQDPARNPRKLHIHMREAAPEWFLRAGTHKTPHLHRPSLVPSKFPGHPTCISIQPGTSLLCRTYSDTAAHIDCQVALVRTARNHLSVNPGTFSLLFIHCRSFCFHLFPPDPSEFSR